MMRRLRCLLFGHDWIHAGTGYEYVWFRCRRCGLLEAL